MIGRVIHGHVGMLKSSLGSTRISVLAGRKITLDELTVDIQKIAKENAQFIIHVVGVKCLKQH